MNISDIFTAIKPYYRQSQGQLWILAIVVLVVVIVITTVYSLYDGLKQISFSGKKDQQLTKVLDATSESTLSQLSKAPLFGVTEQSAMPRINTTLSLLGVMTSADEKKARAFIAIQGQEAKVYKINDEIAEGGRLRSIYSDRVVFQRDGRVETLYLDWTKRMGKNLSASPKITPTNDDTDVLNEENSENSVSESVVVPQTPLNQTPAQIQSPEAWQERLKQIRDQYQKQYNIPQDAVPTPTPFAPAGKGMNYRRGGGL